MIPRLRITSRIFIPTSYTIPRLRITSRIFIPTSYTIQLLRITSRIFMPTSYTFPRLRITSRIFMPTTYTIQRLRVTSPKSQRSYYTFSLLLPTPIAVSIQITSTLLFIKYFLNSDFTKNSAAPMIHFSGGWLLIEQDFIVIKSHSDNIGNDYFVFTPRASHVLLAFRYLVNHTKTLGTFHNFL